MSKIINKVSNGNYMELLSQVTGVITTIDNNFFTFQNKLLANAVAEFSMKFISMRPSDTPPFDTPFITKTKTKKSGEVKSRVIPNPACDHQNVVKTDWFKTMSSFHTKVTQFFERLFPEKQDDIHYIEKVLMGQTFNGHDVSIESEFKLLLNDYNMAGRAIDIILTPSYNVKDKIRESRDLLTSIFKNGKLPKNIGFIDDAVEGGDLEFEQIVNIVYYFTIAEYRSKIMNDSKGYVQIFFKTVGSSKSLNHMNGAKFADFINALDLDTYGSTKEVKAFANKAKDILTDIDNNKNKTNILKSIEELLADPIVEETVEDINGVDL